jgi:phage shock protein A
MRTVLRDYEQKAIDDLTYMQDKIEEMEKFIDSYQFNKVNSHAKELMKLRLETAQKYLQATDRLVRYHATIRRNTKEGT